MHDPNRSNAAQEATETVFENPPPEKKDSRSLGLLDGILTSHRASVDDNNENLGELSEFLSAIPPDASLNQHVAAWFSKLSLWLGDRKRQRIQSRTELVQHLDRDIALIDRLISKQLNAILHHPAFQRLEASWRGLNHLVTCKEAAADEEIKIKVWNVTWRMLRDDLEGAVEFDQSWFFRRVYEEEIGIAGWQAFSALLMDFEVHPRPKVGHPFDDVALLQTMSATAAAAFAPLFIGTHPSMFQSESFAELTPSIDIERMHQQREFLQWRSFRQLEDSRFVTLLLPRMLMRRPYRPEVDYRFGFPFEESTQSSEEYLWGNPIWGMGEVLIRAFAESRWFANIRGLTPGEETGGLVKGPARDEFSTEPHHAATKPITESLISDQFERRLTRLGFTPLCATKYGSEAAFYSIASAQQPKKYNDPIATTNAELSALTNYILCASRFGHYVKILSREKIGSFQDTFDIQTFLSDWLMTYVNRDPDASPSFRAKAPLLDASVSVSERLGRPGEYDCVIQLEPFHGFDDVRATVKLDTRLTKPKST